MEFEQKPNPPPTKWLRASLVLGLFAVTIAVSALVIGSLGQNDGVNAQTGNKQFDFGALGGPGTPTGTSAPHLVSHTIFHSVRLGGAVDAPETSPNDSGGAGDQDGLIFSETTPNSIKVNVWHNNGEGSSYYPGAVPQFPSVNDAPRNRLGTVIVGFWKRVGDTYVFNTLGSSPVRWTHAPVRVDFDRTINEGEEGWMTVLYTQLDLTTACGGNFQGCQTGFTQANLLTWNGTHQDLMRITENDGADPWNVAITPGEVEDYLILAKNGVTTVYTPNDPTFETDGGTPPEGTLPPGEDSGGEGSTGIASIFQPPCSPLVFFKVDITHPRKLQVNLRVENSIDDGASFEMAVVESATALYGEPFIDNEAQQQIQGIRTDIDPESVDISIDTTDFVEETTDEFKIRVYASDGRVSSQPIDTQKFTVNHESVGCLGAAPIDTDGDGIPDIDDPILNPPGDADGDGIPDGDDPTPNGDIPPGDEDGDGIPDEEDPIYNPPGDADGDGIPDEDDPRFNPPPLPPVAPPLPPVPDGIDGTRVTTGNVASFFNFLNESGIDPEDFTTSIGRELATRIAIHILLMNEKVADAEVDAQTRMVYPDSDISQRPGKEIALATFLHIVRGLPDGNFYPVRNPTVVEAYQIIVEMARFMSPQVSRILEEEKIRAQGSPDWFEPYIATLRRFNIPTISRNYFELGELITTLKFAEIIQDLFSQVGLEDPFIRQPNLPPGIFPVE